MEGSSKQHQLPRQKRQSEGGDEEEEGDWEANTVGTESTEDVRDGKGQKHRRARSLMKMLGNSFTKSEVEIIACATLRV